MQINMCRLAREKLFMTDIWKDLRMMIYVQEDIYISVQTHLHVFKINMMLIKYVILY